MLRERLSHFIFRIRASLERWLDRVSGSVEAVSPVPVPVRSYERRSMGVPRQVARTLEHRVGASARLDESRDG